ncbi:MAG TPA: hypothetical protein VIE63_01475 [Ramlibacter sp.]
MSAFKKVAGLVIGVSAVGAIGVALAQGVPPNPNISNPALGAGEQTASHTPIGETGVLAWAPAPVEQTATITREDEQAAVASPPAQDNPQPVASSTDTSPQVAQAPAYDNNDMNNAQSLGAGPSDDAGAPQHVARNDRG